MIDLTPIDVTNLEIISNTLNLRRDIALFVDYVQERDVKRLHRSNALSKSDALRLAKLMSDPEAVAQVREHGESAWVDYIDGVALSLGLVDYDTDGVYAGYNSHSPSFPDNYITVNTQKYEAFLRSSLLEQEFKLLYMLLDTRGGASEFFNTSLLGSLEGFSSWGSGIGVVPMLDFPKARRLLLDLLQKCEVGVWYSTASLIQYLKREHPFFLIPEHPLYKNNRPGEKGRYQNFHESKNRWGHEITIDENDPDAFERVEGRYIERFLEGIPLLMGYVDVAYSNQTYQGLYPSRGLLPAFRIKSRLQQVMRREIPSPKVTIQPNFEIYVESEFYPIHIFAHLLPLTDLVSDDVLTILKLKKEKVAAQAAENEKLDAVALLTELAGRDLPPNVARELKEWTEHSEKFTLYEGYSLLEGNKALPAADPFTVQQIAPNLRLVHSPKSLYKTLEAAELVPLSVKHWDNALRPLPQKARTLFAKKSKRRKPKAKKKETVTLTRQTIITLHVPQAKTLKAFRKAFLDARCPVEVDVDKLMITYSKKYEDQVAAVIKTLTKDYKIRFEDI